MPAEVIHRAIAAQTGRRLLVETFTLSRLRIAKVQGKVQVICWAKVHLIDIDSRYVAFHNRRLEV